MPEDVNNNQKFIYGRLEKSHKANAQYDRAKDSEGQVGREMHCPWIAREYGRRASLVFHQKDPDRVKTSDAREEQRQKPSCKFDSRHLICASNDMLGFDV